MSSAEAIERFACFGGMCGVIVAGDGPSRTAAEAAAHARRSLLDWHARFSRFAPASELSLLNADPRRSVPVSPLMAYLAATARYAADLTDGLIDATLLDELREAGYGEQLPPRLPLELALALAPPRHAASGSPKQRWRALEADTRSPSITRPQGLKLDSGGLAKGLFADVLAETLSGHESFAVDCGGDLTLGGAGGPPRAIEVQSPFDGSTIHSFELARTGVATSGIGRRAWLGADGRPAHHLLDPATGRPAYTGVVQATALAPSAVLAEIHAKAAVLSGPTDGESWLRWGGVLVLDDGSHRVVKAGGSSRRTGSASPRLAAAAA
jgi:thiamine biosynthesis lipoprotein